MNKSTPKKRAYQATIDVPQGTREIVLRINVVSVDNKTDVSGQSIGVPIAETSSCCRRCLP